MATILDAEQRKEAEKFLAKNMPSDLSFAFIAKDLYPEDEGEENEEEEE